jgi:hypothetical protein
LERRTLGAPHFLRIHRIEHDEDTTLAVTGKANNCGPAGGKRANRARRNKNGV